MAKDAIYKLLHQDLAGMLRSFLIGPLRSFLHRYTLEEVFGKKNEMTSALREQLTDYLKSYGFAIHSLEITGLEVSPEIMHAMNEAQKQRRNRDTALVDMAKLCEAKVKEAEAFAVHAELKGQEMSEECQRLIRASAGSELFTSFEGAQIDQAIEAGTPQRPLERLSFLKPEEMQNGFASGTFWCYAQRVAERDTLARTVEELTTELRGRGDQQKMKTLEVELEHLRSQEKMLQVHLRQICEFRLSLI
eukprot:symbB.v1.2.004890.t2/scaffold277.1/size415908/9